MNFLKNVTVFDWNNYYPTWNAREYEHLRLFSHLEESYVLKNISCLKIFAQVERKYGYAASLRKVSIQFPA